MPVPDPADSPLRVRILGTVVRFDHLEPAMRVTLQRDWSRCVVSGPPGPDDIPVDIGAGRSGYALASRLTLVALEQLAGQRLMLHAAGLADADGHVLVLVGPSGTGKTTAAHALATSGWGYVTDETVAIDGAGRVLPYPKPLSIVDPAESHGKTNHGPDALGLGATPLDLRAGAVVVLERERQTDSQPTLDPLPLLDAILELAGQSSYLIRLESPLQGLCRLVDQVGGAHRLTYGEIEDTLPLLAGLTSRAPAGLEPWQPLPLPEAGEPPPGRLVTAQPRDAVLIGDEALVLVDRTPVRLSSVGLTIWQRAATPATDADLLDAAVAEHGDHPDAARVVADAVDTMVEAGLLRRGAVSPTG